MTMGVGADRHESRREGIPQSRPGYRPTLMRKSPASVDKVRRHIKGDWDAVCLQLRQRLLYEIDRAVVEREAHRGRTRRGAWSAEKIGGSIEGHWRPAAGERSKLFGEERAGEVDG